MNGISLPLRRCVNEHEVEDAVGRLIGIEQISRRAELAVNAAGTLKRIRDFAEEGASENWRLANIVKLIDQALADHPGLKQ